MVRRYVLTALTCIIVLVPSARGDPLQDQVLAPSVNFADGCSGTLFRADGQWFVLTAGHCVDHLRRLVDVEVVNNQGIVEKRQKVVFDKTHITRTLYKNNKAVGEQRLFAEVIAYSALEPEGLDVAVLKIPANDVLQHGALWGDSDSLAKVTTDVIHIGNLYGEISGAFCKGSVARLDYQTLGTTFTVLTINGARPGSSGGGVFVKDGDRYAFIGMITRGDQGGLTLMKPTAVIRRVLKENGLETIMDAK